MWDRAQNKTDTKGTQRDNTSGICSWHDFPRNMDDQAEGQRALMMPRSGVPKMIPRSVGTSVRCGRAEDSRISGVHVRVVP